jgi:hypothetical protein
MERASRAIAVSNDDRPHPYCGVCGSSLNRDALRSHRCDSYGGLSAQAYADLFWDEA